MIRTSILLVQLASASFFSAHAYVYMYAYARKCAVFDSSAALDLLSCFKGILSLRIESIFRYPNTHTHFHTQLQTQTA